MFGIIFATQSAQLHSTLSLTLQLGAELHGANCCHVCEQENTRSIIQFIFLKLKYVFQHDAHDSISFFCSNSKPHDLKCADEVYSLCVVDWLFRRFCPSDQPMTIWLLANFCRNSIHKQTKKLLTNLRKFSLLFNIKNRRFFNCERKDFCFGCCC